jgi:hypothetical protein
MYFLNYLCYTWSHGRHFVDSCIALSSRSLTLPNVCASVLFKWKITLIGFPRLGAAVYTQTAVECIESKLNDVCDAWNVASQRRLLDSGSLKGRL